MSLGIWNQQPPDANWTHIIFGDSEYKRNGGGSGGGINLGGPAPSHGVGKHCVDLHERLIPHGVHYVPGPDECTLCACDDGEPKWCKAVLCSPPTDCKSFRVGNSCCEFICLDESLTGGGKVRPPKTGGPYLSGPVEVANFNFVPKVVIAAVTAMLSLSLLFFLIHRLRQKHIQGRLHSRRARRSTQTCDECDDTRSLDFSNDFFEHRMNSPHLYPPQYLAWWKPPSSYFPPRGEAPPPYEEAMMVTTSIGGNINNVLTNPATGVGVNNNTLQNNNNSTSPAVLNHIPIIVPPSVLPPGPVGGGRAGLDPTRSSPAAIQRLASAIANTTNTGGSTTCTTSIPSVMIVPNSASSPRVPSSATQGAEGAQHHRSSPSSRGSPRGQSKPKSSNSKNGSKNKAKDRRSDGAAAVGEPRPGPSRTSIETDTPRETSPLPFRFGPPQHGPAPPTYEDAIYSLNPDPRSAYYLQSQPLHRHSLTLPPKRYLEGIGGAMDEPLHHQHVYPRVIVRGVSSTGVSDPLGAGEVGQGPLTVYTEEELLRRTHQNQRLSLQFHLGGSVERDSLPGGGGSSQRHGGGDWSSSSSTLSLSTSPNSPVGGGRAPSLSSSSESSVSENPPPPPAPSSNHKNTPRA